MCSNYFSINQKDKKRRKATREVDLRFRISFQFPFLFKFTLEHEFIEFFLTTKMKSNYHLINFWKTQNELVSLLLPRQRPSSPTPLYRSSPCFRLTVPLYLPYRCISSQINKDFRQASLRFPIIGFKFPLALPSTQFFTSHTLACEFVGLKKHFYSTDSNMATMDQRLSKLRQLMKKHSLHAYVVPSVDAHQVKYFVFYFLFWRKLKNRLEKRVNILEKQINDGNLFLDLMDQLEMRW